MLPVEKMAARILLRHKLEPPFDLHDLVKNYAEIEYREFPINVDGITINYPNKQPLVLINNAYPETRKRFTLAHELGHIIIPWHIGTIVSKVSSHSTHEIDNWFTYQEMETEANRFASELLTPSSWLSKSFNEEENIEKYLKYVMGTSGVSLKPILIKIEKVIQSSCIIGVTHDGSFMIEARCHNAPRVDHSRIDIKNIDNIFSSATSKESFFLNGKQFICLRFEDTKEFALNDHRPWRDILTQILDETNKHSIKQNINGVIASNFQKVKEQPLGVILAKILNSFDGRDIYFDVIKHPLFIELIKSRITELVNKT